MKRRDLLRASVAAAAATVVGPVIAHPARAAARRPQRHVVEIGNLAFTPAVLAVRPGDTVIWINRDIVPHTATATDKSWGSPTLKRTQEWHMAVSSEIAVQYYCRFHPKMTGRLDIVADD